MAVVGERHRLLREGHDAGAEGECRMSAPWPVIEELVMRHADEAAFLWRQRLNLVDAPRLSLAGLAAHDERIAAHLDGLHVAGEAAAAPLEAQLEDSMPGSM